MGAKSVKSGLISISYQALFLIFWSKIARNFLCGFMDPLYIYLWHLQTTPTIHYKHWTFCCIFVCSWLAFSRNLLTQAAFKPCKRVLWWEWSQLSRKRKSFFFLILLEWSGGIIVQLNKKFIILKQAKSVSGHEIQCFIDAAICINKVKIVLFTMVTAP